jgi:hypothetical protein
MLKIVATVLFVCRVAIGRLAVGEKNSSDTFDQKYLPDKEALKLRLTSG